MRAEQHLSSPWHLWLAQRHLRHSDEPRSQADVDRFAERCGSLFGLSRSPCRNALTLSTSCMSARRWAIFPAFGAVSETCVYNLPVVVRCGKLKRNSLFPTAACFSNHPQNPLSPEKERLLKELCHRRISTVHRAQAIVEFQYNVACGCPRGIALVPSKSTGSFNETGSNP